MSAPRTGSPAPEMQIVRGDASDEELAALVAVFAGLAGATTAEPPGTRRPWADRRHRLRTSL